MLHTIDTYSEFRWAIALSSKKADSITAHLLDNMAIIGILAKLRKITLKHMYLVKLNNFGMLEHKAFYRYTTQSYRRSSSRKI